MAKLSKAKGYTGEVEVAALLKKVWPEAERSGVSVQTIKHAPDVRGVPIWAQVKRRARTWIGTLYKDVRAVCVRHSPTDPPPVWIIHRDDRSPWLVTMELEEALHLQRGYNNWLRSISP